MGTDGERVMRPLLLLCLSSCAVPTGPETRAVHRQAFTVDTSLVPIAVPDTPPRERVIPCAFTPDTVWVDWGGVRGYEIVERCY